MVRLIFELRNLITKGTGFNYDENIVYIERAHLIRKIATYIKGTSRYPYQQVQYKTTIVIYDVVLISADTIDLRSKQLTKLMNSRMYQN